MDDVILITGASAGIGRACADRQHARGWKVVGASRRGIASEGWAPLVMDVDSDTSVASGVEALLSEHGRLDAVVACAGWGLAGAAEQTPMGDAKDQMETNFWGAVRVVQQALPVMRRQGRGRIILISSIGGIIGIPFQSFYSASKFAMEGYGESLAYEVEPFGIQVTLVEPGNVRTDFTQNRRDVVAPDDHDAYRTAAAKALGTMIEDEANGVSPDDVAAVVQRALEARRAPRRLSVGKFDERIGIMGKRLLPYRLFERAAKGSLGV
ncbi:MAG: SDR family oxidoreductase [Acidimicrobiales bacterium]|jgi:NAD(P)-dependent dehydrogenase (short-subunit alcohol dehydrogenase family)